MFDKLFLMYLEELEDKYLALSRLKKPARRWMQDELEKDLDLES